MAAQKKSVVFTQNYTVKDEHEGTAKETRFKSGQRKSLPEASALHFVSRGVAEFADVVDADKAAADKAAADKAAADKAAADKAAADKAAAEKAAADKA